MLRDVLWFTNGAKPIWYHSVHETSLNPCFISAILQSTLVRSRDVLQHYPYFLQCGELSVYVAANDSSTLALFMSQPHNTPNPMLKKLTQTLLSSLTPFLPCNFSVLKDDQVLVFFNTFKQVLLDFPAHLFSSLHLPSSVLSVQLLSPSSLSTWSCPQKSLSFSLNNSFQCFISKLIENLNDLVSFSQKFESNFVTIDRVSCEFLCHSESNLTVFDSMVNYFDWYLVVVSSSRVDSSNLIKNLSSSLELLSQIFLSIFD
ncbi:hypothetical protein RCL1_003783 [Eukaryota sp. TZLM3-RCL]